MVDINANKPLNLYLPQHWVYTYTQLSPASYMGAGDSNSDPVLAGHLELGDALWLPVPFAQTLSMAMVESVPASLGTHLPRVDPLLGAAVPVAAEESVEGVGHRVDCRVHAVDHALPRKHKDVVEGLGGV